MRRLSSVLWWLISAACPAQAAEPVRLAAPVVVDGRTIPYAEFALFMMPQQAFAVRYADRAESGTATFRGLSGALGQMDLRAPEEPGLEQLEVVNHRNGERAVISVFTMVPATRLGADGRLNGYRMGAYPKVPLRGMSIYLPPKGFVEVTADNADVQVSPNFRLGQFACKQEQGFPKYLLLRASLLLKLENILATLNRSGHPVDSFVIMSGYRTPWYNAVLKDARYSRHQWGGAADIYIDENPRDGFMDDLNGDGQVNRDDARWLAEFVDRMSQRGAFGPRVGGLSAYGSTSAHGPFVHVDVRGVRARW